MELKDRVALITGGGTGLGRAIALDLARAGMAVAVNYSRSAAEAEATAEELRALGVPAAALRADVSVAADVAALIDATVRTFGRLDVLIANAGTTVFKPFEDLDGVEEAAWDRIMAVNVKGPWLLAKAAAPHLKAHGAGRMVITASVAGLRPSGSSLPYSVSKAAAIHLARGLAKALAPEVLVNAIAPGLLDTRWTRGHSPATIEGFIRGSPLHRLPTLEDCARHVRALVESDTTTGTVVVVDAGVTL
jgi:3-oxoacyl-[acyl-carrier protein] reductase